MRRSTHFLLLALIVTLTTSLAWSGTSPSFVARWGTTGSGEGHFDFPNGIAVDGAGRVYVADQGNRRVQIFTADGAFISAFGSIGTGPESLRMPRDVAIDASGNIYVGDSSRIVVFDAAFAFLRQWSTGSFLPNHLALDPTNTYLYVTLGRQVFKYTVQGALDQTWFFSSDVPVIGAGIATDALGHVYVPARQEQEVHKYTPDGTLVGFWGEGGSNEGQFQGPEGIAVTQDAQVIVSDGTGRLQEFLSDGSFLALWGSTGTGDGEFLSPTDIAVFDDRIYVIDRQANQVQQFANDITPTRMTSWGEVKRAYR